VKAGRYREKIVEELSHSGFAKVRRRIPEAAAALGVLPEVLYEAHLRYKVRERLLLENHGEREAQIIVTLGDTLYERWIHFCEVLHRHGPGLVRGNIHEYLKGTTEPRYLQPQGRQDTKQLVFFVTMASREALRMRCQVAGINVCVFLRSLLVHLTEGLDFIPGKVAPIPTRAMYKDINKYFIPSKSREAV
jgi:hypothetical protein